jgi:hypothetical protein
MCGIFLQLQHADEQRARLGIVSTCCCNVCFGSVHLCSSEGLKVDKILVYLLQLVST